MLFALNGFSKDKKEAVYPVNSIPIQLKTNAVAICRDYNHVFELKDYEKAVEHIRIVYTILNENGKDYSDMVIPYDRFTKITNLSVKIYDSSGFSDEKFKGSAFMDQNYTTSGAIYDDVRLKTFDYQPSQFPYTIEYQYDIEHNGLIGYPQWNPVKGYKYSVEKSSCKIIWPEGIDIRLKEMNLPKVNKISKTETGYKSIEWKIDTLKALKQEPFSPDFMTLVPHVILAPNRFIFDGVPGEMTSWKEFGNFIWSLNKGRDVLPSQRQSEIRSMVGEIKDTAKAVNQLYEYMQKRTRYVGIHLGIGGYQPFPAETVDRLGYGDCKALSSYMKALLNCVNIPSIYTIAGVGPNRGIVFSDFPTVNQNNHAVLLVPLKNDSIWLECTSQTSPCGYFSAESSGRKVMMVTENGGVLVNTPLFDETKNKKSRFAEFKINQEGALTGSVSTEYSGYQYDNVSNLLLKGYEEQEKEIHRKIGLTGLKINEIKYNEHKGKIPIVKEFFNLNSELFGTKTSTRLFFPLNALNKLEYLPEKTDERKTNILQEIASSFKDSVIYFLPEGFIIESLPKGKSLNTLFGSYNTTITQKENTIFYTRELKLNQGEWAKEKYTEFVDFYANIVNSDKVKVVLKQNQ